MCAVFKLTWIKLKYLGKSWKKHSFVKNQYLCFICGILAIPLGCQGLPPKKKPPSEINVRL